ncbi:MAG: phosphate ABC transporter permease subunit PstC [Deltaproteobacteria bacterium]|nr:phosphate ABC transporter permease subunit PstC [Deltaproteobacteria bacterium]
MISSYSFIIILISGLGFYFLGRAKALTVSRSCGGVKGLHSLPCHYGMLTTLWCALPALLIFVVWHAAQPHVITSLVVADLPAEIGNLPQNELSLVINDIRNIVSGNITTTSPNPAIQQAAQHYRSLEEISARSLTAVVLTLILFAGMMAHQKISPSLKARNKVEKLVEIVLLLCSAFAILITIGIVLSVLFEALRFFKVIPFTDFLFGLSWSPQTSIRADQVGSSGAFGAVPVFAGTAMIALIAMLVAVPIGLMSAIYLSEYAGNRFRTVAKPLLEILAGIPTVVYGFFAALTVAPFIRDAGEMIGLSVSSESALAAGLVMGIMIIPFVSSLSDDVIHAVPQSMRDGALALGATKYETVRHVIIPAALPGIVGGVLLAVSRAIGETMIVVMAAGLSANLTANPLKAVTTVTVQIVTLLVGDQEFDSPKTLAAFALGLLLFAFTLVLNIIALYVVRKYREQYE